MSKRNFILLIIILVIVILAVFGFLYFKKPAVNTTGDNTEGGTNFFSQFNPFGKKPTPPVVTPPINVPEYQPSTEETSAMKLIKVSSMPVAGFAIFAKERLKEIPTTPPLAPLLNQ